MQPPPPLSPFEATLRDLSRASRQCERELQLFFADTQRAAHKHASAVERAARAVIRDTHAKLRTCTVAIKRRHRRNRRRAARNPREAPQLQPSARALSQLAQHRLIDERHATHSAPIHTLALHSKPSAKSLQHHHHVRAREHQQEQVQQQPQQQQLEQEEAQQQQRVPQVQEEQQLQEQQQQQQQQVLEELQEEQKVQQEPPEEQQVQEQPQEQQQLQEQLQEQHQVLEEPLEEQQLQEQLQEQHQVLEEPQQQQGQQQPQEEQQVQEQPQEEQHVQQQQGQVQQEEHDDDETILAPGVQLHQQTVQSDAADAQLHSAPTSGNDNVAEEASQPAATAASSQPADAEPLHSNHKTFSQRESVEADCESPQSQPKENEHVEKHPIATADTEHSNASTPKQVHRNSAVPVVEQHPVPPEPTPSSPEIKPGRGAHEMTSQGTESSTPDSMPAPKQIAASRIPRKKSTIVVDNTGKIDHASLGVLSSMMSTKPAEAMDVESTKGSEEASTPRTAKLFKPNHNIYSQQVGNGGSAQKFSSSSRSSTLSHTPGAEAPLRRRSPVLSRQEQLAVLNKQLEGVQSSKRSTALQGPELQVAELRHGRKAARFLDDPEKAKHSQVGREDERLFRSVRDRAMKMAETNVKETSKMDVWSLRAKGAKTTPARERLRALERSKSKIAFRSHLKEIMTGKSRSAEEQASRTEDKGRPLGKILLEDGDDGDCKIESEAPASHEVHLSGKLSDEVKPSFDFIDREAIPSSAAHALPNTAVNHSGNSEAEGARLASGDSDAKSECPSALRTTSLSKREEEDEDMVHSDVGEAEAQHAATSSAPLSNLVSSIVSFLPGSSSLLGTRPTREQSEETEAEANAKRQKLDMERREAELQARREQQRFLRQKEIEEKQRRAEKRRLLLARAEKEREEERRRKEERRMKKRLEEEEARRKKKHEEDKKKEERRRLVLEKRAQNEMKLKRKKKGTEALGARKGGTALAGKALMVGAQGVKHSLGTEFEASQKRKLSGTPSTPVTKKADGSQGASNYDMTPAQETVFELSDEEEERRKHKQIPQWAQGRKLSTAARAQPDPDNVFVNVPTCDLREVFGNVRRFRARTSSANWTRDRVTAQEMVKFRKGQSAFKEAPQ